MMIKTVRPYCAILNAMHDNRMLPLSTASKAACYRESGYEDTGRNYSRKPSQAHVQARNVSPPTQGNKITQAAHSTTRATNGNLPHMHQTRKPRTRHSTAHAKVAPLDKQITAPTETTAGTSLEYSDLQGEVFIHAALSNGKRLDFHALILLARRCPVLLVPFVRPGRGVEGVHGPVSYTHLTLPTTPYV